MKKTYKLIDLDCANCAAKMENAIKKIDGVTDATATYHIGYTHSSAKLTQKSTTNTS